jgi:hypothetical protein
VLDRFRNARTGAAQSIVTLFRATKPAAPEAGHAIRRNDPRARRP